MQHACDNSLMNEVAVPLTLYPKFTPSKHSTNGCRRDSYNHSTRTDSLG